MPLFQCVSHELKPTPARQSTAAAPSNWIRPFAISLSIVPTAHALWSVPTQVETDVLHAASNDVEPLGYVARQLKACWHWIIAIWFRYAVALIAVCMPWLDPPDPRSPLPPCGTGLGAAGSGGASPTHPISRMIPASLFIAPKSVQSF